MSVDPGMGMAVWRQVMQIITSRIEDGTYVRGRLMPSMKHFAQEFEVSEGTVKHALAEMKSQGVIDTENGRGSWPL